MTTASSTDSVSGRLRRFVGRLPRDVIVVLTSTVLAAFVLGTVGDYTTPRAIVGLVFVLVLPGYALVAALFPGRPRGRLNEPSPEAGYSPGAAERLALSFGLSLALLPLLALVHGLLSIPFTTATVVASVTVLVVLLAVVATVRRLALPPAERYQSPSLVGLGARYRAWLARGETLDTVVAAVLTVAVVAALASVAWAATAPTAGASFTEAALVTENESGGYVASGYPTNFTAGEEESLTLRVQNHHDEAIDYTVVGELQRVEEDGSSLAVQEREPLASTSETVAANETWTFDHSVEPTTTGENLQLTYYVYEGDAPDTPDAESASQTVHVWVTVNG